ncbi:MAG: four helix bundle protein [Opitutaceae bacterium]|nr:four helix bundle protein [Opitutaceae bacterium]
MTERGNGSSRTGIDLEERTLEFAVRIIALAGRLPRTAAAVVVGRQLLRAGTSIGANYREANRAESKNDFVHKITVALKEAAETEYWLLLCSRTGLGDSAEVAALSREIDELIAILTTIRRRARTARS